MNGEMWTWCMDYCSKNRLPVGENWAWELAKRRYTEENGGADVSVYHYRVIFKPQTIAPNVDFECSADAMVHDLTK